MLYDDVYTRRDSAPQILLRIIGRFMAGYAAGAAFGALVYFLFLQPWGF